jgi:hypothetical protein
MVVEGGSFSAFLGFKCLETITKKNIKTCWSYFFPQLWQLYNSMMHYNPLNHESSWRAHILCVATTLKVTKKPKKTPTHWSPQMPFCHTKSPTLLQILHTSGVGLVTHELNTLVHFTTNWKCSKQNI